MYYAAKRLPVAYFIHFMPKNLKHENISIIKEARISGDIYNKKLELPLGKFQTTNSTDLEQTISAGSAIRTILDRKILKNVFEAAGLLVFIPVLIGYSPILAGIVLLFSFLLKIKKI